ncbi:transcriptional regulator [Opitutaceae bacterium TAV1]|nr:LacI family transcriptional regulator [Opitutaceae bacterium TAV5]EIQ00967.1 transcriptional regulator [Opitutaceae bacterium TAV1]
MLAGMFLESRMNPLPGITLQSIAKAAGVARSTVSKALRNDPTIPAETCRRIQAQAKKLGYKPSPAVSALMSQLRRNRHRKHFEPVAFVTAFPTPDKWRSMIQYKAYFDGATQRCEELGFRLEEFWLGSVNWQGARLSNILQTRAIRGVLLAPAPATTVTRIDMDWTQFSIVAFGYGLKNLPCHRVTNDQYRTLLRLLSRLDHLGYRRIGLMYPKSSDQSILNYLFAATSVYQSYLPQALHVPPLMVEHQNSRDLIEWIRQHRPDAVVVSHSDALKWLKEAGIRVPEDLGVAFFSGRDIRAEKLAGMDQNPRHIGMTAIELMAEQLYENRTGIPAFQKIVLVEGEWNDGWTVRDQGIGPSLDWSRLL